MSQENSSHHKTVYYDELNEDQKDFVDLHKEISMCKTSGNAVIIDRFCKRVGCNIAAIKHRSAWDELVKAFDMGIGEYTTKKDIRDVLWKVMCKYETQLKEIK